jgi:hypothetical protein
MLFKSLKKSIVFSVIAVFCYGIFVSCENPFTGNLGAKVDVEPPTITVTAPTSGAIIQGTTQFTGRATAYRNLKEVKVRIFNPNVTAGNPNPYLVDWTAEGVQWLGVDDTARAKGWYYNLDTVAFSTAHNLEDGFLKVQFQASDENQSAETIQMVFIVKNNPSVVKLTAPDHNTINNFEANELSPAKLISNTELRGQIIDRRGIKPGYPMIKIWPDNEFPDAEPPANHEQWGWASLFLSGVDSLEDSGWTYADRNEMNVENARSFVFKLAEFTINTKDGMRQINYKTSPDGDFIALTPEKYRFRIKTSDSYFITDTEAPNFMFPRSPEGDEKEIIGYYPVISTESGTEAEWDESGKSYVLQVISSGVRPAVQLDNEDIDESVLASTPNIYINEGTAKKIALGKAGRPDFRLRVVSSHPEGIAFATLRYELAGTTRNGYLPWDDEGGRGYVDSSNPAEEGHYGWLKDPSNPAEGTLFRFTADSELYRDIFTTSTEPYTLIITVWSTGGKESGLVTEQRFTLYMDGEAPDVSIRAMRGASVDPDNSGSPSDGGWINNTPYVVNGNIQVSVDRSDDMGIVATKWIVETKNPNDPDSTLSMLKTYKNEPNWANFAFFERIQEERHTEGFVKVSENQVHEMDKNNNFKFNTWNGPAGGPNAWNGQDLWLYIIAEDGVQNLGFVLQKLTVDDSGDMPVLELPLSLSSTTDAEGITAKEQLYWDITGTFPDGTNIDRAKNIRNEGIELTLIDDDGIKLEGITITLTNLDTGGTVTLSVAQLRSFLNGKETDGSSREWSGVLSQQIMAQALYGQSMARLPDGLYKLTIQVTDNIDAKVAITPPVREGDTPIAVTTENKVYFFGVQSEDPEINITAPADNQQMGKDSVFTIYGTARSRLRIQQLHISFAPDIISATPSNNISPSRNVDLYRNGTYENKVNPFGETEFTDGYYVYYWKYAGEDGNGVRFGRDDFSAVSDDRAFTLTAWDGMNNTSGISRRVNVDNTPPDVELDVFNFDREGYQNDEGDRVNGKVPVEISVYDENGVGITYYDTINTPPVPNPADVMDVKWWVVRADLNLANDYFVERGWDTPFPTGAEGAGGQFIRADMVSGGKYMAVFDTTPFDEYNEDTQREYHLYAMAIDDAKNSNGVERLTETRITSPEGVIIERRARPFRVDQNGDLPVVKQIYPEGGITVRNREGLFLEGIISDDDGYDFTKLDTRQYAQIRYPMIEYSNPLPNNSTIAEEEWGAWEDLPLLKAGNDIQFRLDTTTHDYFKVEYYRYYQIRLFDEPEAGAKAPGSNYGTPPGKNPERSELGLAPHGRAVSIYPRESGPNNYYDFLIKNDPPQVFFDNYDPNHASGPAGWEGSSRPAYSDGIISKLFTDLKTGYILEPTVISAATFIYTDTNKDLWEYDLKPYLTRGTGANINRYYWDIPEETLKEWMFDFDKLAETLYSIAIEASDGVSPTRVDWSFWKDNDGPVISATNVDMSAALANRIITGRAGSDVLIRGLFSDTLSDVDRAFEYKFDNGSWTPGTIAAEVPDGRTMQWAVVVPTTLGDGTHTLNIRANDMAENVTETIPNPDTTIITNIPIVFNLDRTAPAVTSPEHMIVKMTDTGVNIGNKLADHERIFSAAYATVPTDNTTVYTLRGLVYDRNLSGLTARFYPGGAAGALEGVDYPEYPIVLPDGIVTYNWNTTNRLWFPNETARLRVRKAEAADYGTADNLPPRIDNESGVNDAGVPNAFVLGYLYVWELDVSKGDLKKILDKVPSSTTLALPDLDDGKIRRQISVTAQDRAGRGSDMQNWRFYLDNVKPKIDFVNAHVAPVVGGGQPAYQYYTTNGTSAIAENLRPARIDLVSGNFSLEGSASDGTYIKDIRFRLSRSNSGTGTPWTYYSGTGDTWNSAAVPAWRTLLTTADTGANSKSNVSWVLNNSKLGNGYPATLSNGLYRLELEVTDYSIANTAANPGNPATATVEFYIDGAEPTIVWRNNNSFNSALVQKDFYHPADTTFYFTASDLNNIAGYMSAEVRRYGETAAVTGLTITVTPTAGTANASPRNVTVTITGLTDTIANPQASRFTLALNVRDLSGREAADGNTLDFSLDNKPPTMTLAPAGDKETIVGRTVLRGSFIKDISRSPVVRVAFRLATSTNGTSFEAAPAAPVRGSTSDTQLTAAGWFFNNGTNVNNNSVIISGTSRLAEITDGLSSANLTLPNTRSLMTNLNATTGSRYLLNDRAVVAAGEFNFNGVAIPAGDLVNELRIYFLLIDEVGNSTVVPHTYYVYPEGDRPEITVITSPDQSVDEEQRLLNGTIRIGGQARDNVYVKNVWFRVFLNAKTTPETLDGIPNWNQTTWDVAAGTQTSSTLGTNGAGWYMANGGGSRTVTWWADINAGSELDPPMGERNKIRIEVLAEDSALDDFGDITAAELAKVGLYSKLPHKNVSAYVVSGGPVFTEELVLNGRSADGPNFTASEGWGNVLTTHVRKRASYAIKVEHISPIIAIRWTRPNNAGTVNLLDTTPPPAGTAASDSYTYNLTTYGNHISVMNGAGDYNATNNPGIAVKAVKTGPSSTDYSDAYWVVVDINSEILPYFTIKDGVSVQDGFYKDKADNYTLSLDALDGSRPSPLVSRRSAIVPIDNIPPKGYYTHSTNIAGEAPSFGGTAGDTDGKIGGFSRVVLWFSRKDGSVERSVPWEELNPDGTILRGFAQFQGGGTPPDGVTNIPAGISIPLIPAGNSTSGNFSSIVIDRNDPSGWEPHHGHQHKMGKTPGGDLGNQWYVILNSTLMTSGRTTAHFIVYDMAGNASYYSQSLMILNNIPRITRITLGTDIRGDIGVPAAMGTGTGNISRSNTEVSLLQTIRNTFKSNTSVSGQLPPETDKEAFDTAVGIRSYTIDTKTLNNYNVVYDEPFNVRNNLLTVGVEIGEVMKSKNRRYSVEYVTGAANSGNAYRGANFYNNIAAGGIYMIDNPGTFPWGLFGAPGDSYTRGFVFLATLNGNSAPGLSTTSDYGGASVWRLETSQTTDATGANRAVAPVNYAYTITTPDGSTNGKLAEFVYRSGAFTGTTPIADFTPSSLAADGRPLPYLQSGETPWINHSLFVVRVYDADPNNATPSTDDQLFGDFVLLSIRVNNSDKTRPFAQLYDLNPRAEQAAAATVRNPDSIGGNRTKSGLWSTTENDAIVKSGHIEPRATTSLNNADMGGAANVTRATIYNPMVTTDANAFVTTDTVSGEVILRGYVEDDQRIGGVNLEFISTTTTTVNLLTSEGAPSGALLRALDRVSFKETIDLDRHRVEWAYLWDSEAMPANLIVGNINIRVIAQAIPTTLDSGAARTRDNAGNATFDYYNPGFPTYSASDTNIRRYNQIPVNIRPYITGILRNTSTFAHNTRSRQGWYMLAQNEAAVVKGFNLGGGSTSGTAISLATGTYNATAVGDSAGNFGLTGTPLENRYRLFTVNPAQGTGDGMVTLTVTAGATNYPAVNTGGGRGITSNRPNAIQPWNTERSPDIIGSDLWDDFTSVHIWSNGNTTGGITDNGDFPIRDRWVPMDPAMSVDPSKGVLYSSHNEGGGSGDGGTQTNASFLMETNNGLTAANTNQQRMQSRDPIIHSDIYRTETNTWTVSNLIGKSNSTQVAPGNGADGEVWNAYGGIFIRGPGGSQANINRNSVDYFYTSGTAGGTVIREFYLAESAWYNNSTYNTVTTNGGTGAEKAPSTIQFRNPHIITYASGTDEHIHVSYFDDKDKSIKYRYNLKNAAGTGAGVIYEDTNSAALSNNIPKMWTNLDGGLDAEDLVATTYAYNANAIAANARVVRSSAANNTVALIKTARSNVTVGEHNAIAVTSQGFPVIAYYDTTNSRLKLAVSRTVNPVLNTQWVIRDKVIPDGNLSQFGTGQFVSIAIDRRETTPTTTQNTIHIAAMNTNGNLVYIKGLLNPTSGTGNRSEETGGVLTNVTVQVVDSLGTVGRWCKISLDSNGNPWIAYQDASYIGAKDGVKVAYYNSTFNKGSGTTVGVFPFPSNRDTDLYGGTVTGWETMHVPTGERVENPIMGTGEQGHIGLECYPKRNYEGDASNKLWSAAVSYLASDRYRIMFYVK